MLTVLSAIHIITLKKRVILLNVFLNKGLDYLRKIDYITLGNG